MGTAHRKVRERRARKIATQAAAVRVFGDKGFSRATMEDIARQAEVSVGTIYLYYRSKEDLYVSLLFESMQRMIDAIEKIMASGLRPDWQLKRVSGYFYDYTHATRSPTACSSSSSSPASASSGMAGAREPGAARGSRAARA